MTVSPKSTVRMEKVVQAASGLFARQGYCGTSTREIAHSAGVSENTLFRNFENKEDLFWAAIRFQAEGLTMRRDLVQGISRNDALEVVLPKIVDLIADTAAFRPELPRLIAVAYLELNWKAEAFCREKISPVLATIHDYLVQCAKQGQMRVPDPTMTMTALIATVLLHPGLSKLIVGPKASASESKKTARAYTKFWLELLVPRPTTPQELLSSE
jgi:AcrR family transcriptional regulator